MKRFVFAAIFAVCFVFLYSCGDNDEDSSITRLQSHLDGRLDNIEGEIDTLREDVNTLAAETKTPLTDGLSHRIPVEISTPLERKPEGFYLLMPP